MKIKVIKTISIGPTSYILPPLNGRTYPYHFNSRPDRATHVALCAETEFPTTKDWQRYREAEVEAMRQAQRWAWAEAKSRALSIL